MSTVTAARDDLRTPLRRATDALPRASIGTAPLIWQNVETAAGRPPTDALTVLDDRVRHLHLKDVDPAVLEGLRSDRYERLGQAVLEALFTELGAGVLDLDGVLGLLVERDCAGWLIVEQDWGWGPPSESAAIGRRVLGAALRRLGTAGTEGSGA